MSERKRLVARRGPTPLVVDVKQRKLRWSWRYQTWQVNVNGRPDDWRNIRAPLARCYAAAGLEVLTSGD